ncbi:MAG: CDP-alcohol phosphatidyltransferase family protein [Alphaproteobacteria bacterium]|nr:CDP-alcohol phosphatidyltransferase family protein [Alphaproteobacteria bacterium]
MHHAAAPASVLARPERAFPLVRHVSVPLSRVLARLPVTPNQITTVSLAAALGAAWCFADPGYGAQLAGALLFLAFYVLDNCDGEIARAKGLSTRFGLYYDTFVDWIGHAALFVGLGIGAAALWDAAWWFWLGVAGAAGGTVNYFLGLAMDLSAGGAKDTASAPPPERTAPPRLIDTLGYVLRELTRADFCFILLALALAGWAWALLPAAALGAQAYWLAAFIKGVREHHV